MHDVASKACPLDEAGRVKHLDMIGDVAGDWRRSLRGSRSRWS
jgi:hypothetical protein